MGKMLFSIFMLAMLAGSTYASGLEDADYTTPDSWQMHTTAQGFVKSVKDHKFGNGTMNVSLTSKMKLLDNDYQADSNFYQYLKVNIMDVAVAEGTMTGVLFMRAAKDLDGDDGFKKSGRYYFRDDILDAEDEDWAVRVYQGYLRFTDVIKNTDVTIGNQYVTYLDRIHLNGLDAKVKLMDDKLKVFAFGGQPDTFYLDDADAKAAGGGFIYQAANNLKFTTAYTYVDMDEETSDIVKLRADYFYSKGRMSGEYGNTDGNSFYTVEGTLRNDPSKTILSVTYTQLIDEIGKGEGTYISNPITYSLSPYGKYSKVKVLVRQGITQKIVSGFGVEVKSASGEDTLDNRSYAKYSTNLDFVGVFTENTYFSLTADYWDIAESIDTESSSNVAFGGELTQVLSDMTDIWVGTSFNRFEYDLDEGVEKNWVREVYLGGSHKFNDRAAVTLDMSYENSEILEDIDTSLQENYRVEAWFSLAI